MASRKLQKYTVSGDCPRRWMLNTAPSKINKAHDTADAARWLRSARMSALQPRHGTDAGRRSAPRRRSLPRRSARPRGPASWAAVWLARSSERIRDGHDKPRNDSARLVHRRQLGRRRTPDRRVGQGQVDRRLRVEAAGPHLGAGLGRGVGAIGLARGVAVGVIRHPHAAIQHQPPVLRPRRPRPPPRPTPRSAPTAGHPAPHDRGSRPARYAHFRWPGPRPAGPFCVAPRRSPRAIRSAGSARRC